MANAHSPAPCPGGGFLASEQENVWLEDRYAPPSEQKFHRQLVSAPQANKPKPSRAEAAPAMPTPENDKGPAPLKAEYERARASLVHFACAIDVPGRPVSEDVDDPLYANIETALAPHHQLLL